MDHVLIPVLRNIRLVFLLLQLNRRARDGILGDIPLLLLLLLVAMAHLLGENNPPKRKKGKQILKPTV